MIDDATAGTISAASPPQRRRPVPVSVDSSRWWLGSLLRAGSYGLGFGLLGWALWKNQGAVREVFGGRPDFRWLAASFVLGELALVSTFARWALLARVQGAKLTLLEAIRIGFLGHASELIVPGQLGGDVVKVAACCRGQGEGGKARLIASVMLDRVIGVFGLFLLVSLVGGFQWSQAPVAVRRLIAIVWGGTGAGVIGFAVLFLPAPAVLFRRSRGERGLGLLEKADRLWAAAAAYRDRPFAVGAALVLAMISHLIYALSFYAVICSLFPTVPPLGRCLVLIPLILFTAIVPLPLGALGVGEGVSGELFRMIGSSIGAPAMLGARCIGLGLSSVSVLVYLLSRQRRTRPAAVAPGDGSRF